MHVFIIDTESANCTLNNYNYQNDGDIEMAEISIQGLDGSSCNLSINATESIAQCLQDIEIVNNDSKQIRDTTNKMCVKQ